MNLKEFITEEGQEKVEVAKLNLFQLKQSMELNDLVTGNEILESTIENIESIEILLNYIKKLEMDKEYTEKELKEANTLVEAGKKVVDEYSHEYVCMKMQKEEADREIDRVKGRSVELHKKIEELVKINKTLEKQNYRQMIDINRLCNEMEEIKRQQQALLNKLDKDIADIKKEDEMIYGRWDYAKELKNFIEKGE